MPSAIGSVIGGIFGSPGSSTKGSGNSSSAGINNNNSSSNASSNSTSAISPNLPDWYSKFLQGLPSQFNQLLYQTSQPAIGQQQIAQYQQNLDRQVGNATQQTMSQLAKAGALNSGRAAQSITDLQLGKMGDMSNYLAQVPVINQQQMFNQGSQLLGQGFGFKAPYGQTNQNWNNNWNNSSVDTLSTNTSAQNQKNHNGGSGLLGAI